MSALIRAASRLLSPSPDTVIAVHVADADLASALSGAIETAGARAAGDGDALDAAVLDAAPPNPLVAADAQGLIGRVKPDGTVVLVMAGGVGSDKVEVLAGQLGPCFDLAHVHAERAGEALLIRGRRRSALPRAEIKRLRGIGHGIEASVLVGRPGLTAEIVGAARTAVERHGLIKVKLTPQCPLDKREVAREMAWATGSQLVQRIGKTAVLYRSDVPLDPPTPQSGRRKGR